MGVERERSGTEFWFPSALTDSGWQDNVGITVGPDGITRRVEAGAPRRGRCFGSVLLPALVNVHSHAFQRGFAGLSEYRTGEADSFWTWRRLMYDFVDRLRPEDVRVIARQVYLEMLAAGYAWVGEFHYLHHDGRESSAGAARVMSDAVLGAAQEAGIGICLLPVLYQRAGFREEPLARAQQRFRLDVADLVELVQSLQRDWAGDQVRIGAAIHSLRAVGTGPARELVAALRKRSDPVPLHVHVAEQTAEVDACREAHGERPVERLLKSLPVDESWCLIHATHMNAEEISAVAAAGAVVGLCPTTEANLGDGYFPAVPYLEAGGRISVGSDSHCCTDWREELRTLEYGERLQRRQRAVLADRTQSVGRRLFSAAVSGGGQAIGLPTGGIAPGRRADWMLIDPDHPVIAGAKGDRLLDRMVCISQSAACGSPLRGVVIGGQVTDFDDSFRERFAASSAEFQRVVAAIVED